MNGALKVQLDDAFQESLESASVVFFVQSGKPVPFFIEDSPEGQEDLLKLEEVDSPEVAKTLSNLDIYLRAEDVDVKKNQLDASLAGFELWDEEEGCVGLIEEVVQYPQQLMAIVKDGEVEFLIPLNEAFLLNIDPDEKVIVMDLPEGLLDL